MTLLHLIRHGRASASEAEYDKLHTVGEDQARLLGEHFKRAQQHFDRIFVGPLKRQVDTLALMREAAGDVGAAWPQAITLPGLEEAPYEPLLRAHIEPRLATDEVLQGFLKDLTEATDDAGRHAAMTGAFDYMVGLWRAAAVAPELQSYADFQRAVGGAIDAMRSASAAGEHVAVITSNGVIGSILEQTGGLQLGEGEGTLKLANTSVSLLELNGEGATLKAQNVTEHLTDPEMITVL